MDTTILYVVCAVFGFFAVMIAYRLVRYKGFTGSNFAAVPIRIVGEVDGVGDGPIGSVARIHLLNKQNGRAVGLERREVFDARIQKHNSSGLRGLYGKQTMRSKPTLELAAGAVVPAAALLVLSR